MEAIILAAGRGNRLSGFNPDGRPKCLLEFGGRTLLDRQLESLLNVGIARVELVIGYEADRVIEHVGKLGNRPEVAFAYNPRFRQGSVLSLLAARDVLTSNSDAFILDADVLFHPDIMKHLAASRHANCFLLDGDFEPGDEPVKIAILNDRMVEFRKALADDLVYDRLGESVGFFRFDGPTCAQIARACAQYDAEGLGDAPHEEVIRDVLLADPQRFAFEEVSGMPWVEIDFPADVETAIKHVLPAMELNEYD